MNITFDHLVHYVESPYEISSSFAKMGFHVANGGRHDLWGTFNTLCYFQNLSYIEWIGIENLEVTKKGSHPFSQHIYEDFHLGEGLSQLAFRTTEITEVKRSLSKRGVKTIGPLKGSRARPDGSLLKWSMLFIDHGLPMPFFIQWGEPDSLREQQLLAKKVIVPHNKVISYVAYGVRDPVLVANIWGNLFQGKVELGDVIQIGDTSIICPRVRIDSIDIFFFSLSDTHVSTMRGERPYIVGIDSREGKITTLHGGIYHW